MKKDILSRKYFTCLYYSKGDLKITIYFDILEFQNISIWQQKLFFNDLYKKTVVDSIHIPLGKGI